MREDSQEIRKFHVHLVSDATGVTLQGLARACLAQFDGISPLQKLWPMVQTEEHLYQIIEHIEKDPGPVLFTFVDPNLRGILSDRCHDLGIPALAVLDPIIKGLSSYLGLPSRGVPGLQHAMDDAYFERMEAVDFALSYDDGRNVEGLESADVILVGVSRTSKTPTCIFLARRGIRAANIPLVPGVPFPEEILNLKHPLFVGLTESPQHLLKLRTSRLQADKTNPLYAQNSYLDLDAVREEVKNSRNFFHRNGWPVIDVTRRSIEETAGEIQALLKRRRAEQ